MAHTPNIELGWLREARKVLKCEGEEADKQWRKFADRIDVLEPQNSFRDLNDHLKFQPFLHGMTLHASDLHVYSRIRLIPAWSRVISNKNRPPYLARWYIHINSLFPHADPSLKTEKVHFDLRLHEAIRSNDLDLAHRLMQVVNLYERNPKERGMQAIHVAAFKGNQHALEMLLAAGVPIDTLDTEGMTPLFYAAHKGHIAMLKFLIANGANASHVEHQGRTALYWAANAGKTEVLELLMKSGCDPNVKTKLGRSALSKAAWSAQVGVVLALCESPQVVLEDMDMKGRCSLHTAVWGESGGRAGKKMAFGNTTDSPECAEILITFMKRRGISIDIPDKDGNTPLSIAASTNAPNSVKVLLRHGADPQYRNNFDNTPLHEAVRGGHLHCVEILVEHGVDPNEIGFEGYSPLHKSIHFGRVVLCRYLLSLPTLVIPQSALAHCIDCRQGFMLKLILEKYTGTLPSDLLLKAVQSQDQDIFATVFQRMHGAVDSEVITKAAGMSDFATFQQIMDVTPSEEIPQNAFVAAAANPDLSNLQLLLSKVHISDPTFIALLRSAPEPACSLVLSSYPALWAAMNRGTLETPLHIACFRGLSLLADQLLQLSAEQCCSYIAQKDVNALTAHTYAIINRHASLAAYLEDLYQKGTQKPLETRVVQLTYTDIVSDSWGDNSLPEDEYPKTYPRLGLKWLTLDETPVEFVDSEDGLTRLEERSKAWRAVGVDVEYFSFDQKRGVVALLQLSDGTTDYILDTLQCHEAIGFFIRSLMRRSDCVKIFHGADSDLIWLQTDFEACSVNVFDTARAHKTLTRETDLPSLAKLIQTYLALPMDKTFQVADWRIRPLPPPMLKYAREDAHYLIQLYTILTTLMDDVHLQSTAMVCSKLCRKPVSSRHQRVRVRIVTPS